MIADPALLLIDLQKSFCDPSVNDALATAESQGAALRGVVDRSNELAKRFRERGRTPIFVRSENDRHSAPDDSYLQRSTNAPPPCLPGSTAAEFANGLDVRDDDVVITKHRYGSFTATNLEHYLSSADVSEVLIGGVNTQICVLAAAFGLLDRDYNVTVLSDCCGASSMEGHEAGLEVLSTVADDVRSSVDIELAPLA